MSKLKLTRLEVEGFKRIVAINIKVGEHVTEISGKNGAGKSSTLDAIWTLLDGKRVAPKELINQNTERCLIRGHFGELIVTREYTRGKHGEITGKLRIESGGEAFPPTEKQLAEIIGEHMLDPGDFVNLKDEDKFNLLKSLVPNVDFAKLEREHRADYDRRTKLNSAAKEARAAAVSVIIDGKLPFEPVDEAALVTEMEKASEHNVAVNQRRADRDVWRHSLDLESKKFEERQRQIAALVKQCEEGGERIVALNEKLAEYENIPSPIDVTQISARLNEARKINANAQKVLERNKHLQNAKRLEEESESLTEQMEARDRAKQKVIADANLPIPALTFTQDSVLLDGVPFEQASTAQKFRVGAAIAFMKNPTLRLIWIRDASLLDDETYADIERMAIEEDCQVLLETVRPIGKDVILLENGEVKEETVNHPV